MKIPSLFQAIQSGTVFQCCLNLDTQPVRRDTMSISLKLTAIKYSDPPTKDILYPSYNKIVKKCMPMQLNEAGNAWRNPSKPTNVWSPVQQNKTIKVLELMLVYPNMCQARPQSHVFTNFMTQMLLSPFCREWNESTERLSNMPVTQPTVVAEPGLLNQASLAPKSALKSTMPLE